MLEQSCHPVNFTCHLQNKLQDLHRQIEDLTTKVSSLQSENAALHSRTSILEKVCKAEAAHVFLGMQLHTAVARLGLGLMCLSHILHPQVLDMRNEQIQVMQESKEVGDWGFGQGWFACGS
jgi:hypothetical protein